MKEKIVLLCIRGEKCQTLIDKITTNNMKKITLGIGALALTLGALAVTAGTTFAYQGDPTVEGPNYSPDRHEAMTDAFESNDYDAWYDLMAGRGRVTQVINEDNFAKFAEAHELVEQGKVAEAQQLRQELGLGQHNNTGAGRGNGGNCTGTGTGRGGNR